MSNNDIVILSFISCIVGNPLGNFDIHSNFVNFSKHLADLLLVFVNGITGHNTKENIQQIDDAPYKGLQLIIRWSSKY